MDFDITSVKITGNPDAGGWCQVHEFQPSDELKLASRGRLFAVLATSQAISGVESVALGREIISRLQEEYFGNHEASAFYALNDAVDKIIREFSNTLNSQIEIAAAAFVNGILYTTCGGGAQAAVYRNNTLGKILISKPNEVISASGYPQESDVFLLGTAAFYSSFSDGVIKANIESGLGEKINEAFGSTLYSLPESGNCGVVVVSFKKGQAQVEAEVAEVPNKPPLVLPKFPKPRLPLFLTQLPNRFPRKVYVKRSDFETGGERSKKTVMTVGILLLLLLLVSIGFGLKQKNTREFKTTYIEELTAAQHNFDESQQLLSLNPERARELFASSRSSVQNLLAKGIKDDSLTTLNNQITENQGRILGEYSVPAELYLDLTLLSSGFQADRLAANSTDMAILDRQGKKVVGVTIANKKSRVVAGPDSINAAADVTLYAERIFVLSNDGILELEETTRKVINQSWQDNSFIHAYAGNIYVIDVNDNNILRFAASGDGFASGTNWLAEKSNFSNFAGWSIDGSIWVAKDSGEILRFTQGVRNAFEIKGLSPSLAKIQSVYTNEELKYLYLLDSQTGRIVVVDKNGEFKAQYLDPGLTAAVKIAVSEADKKMIFLTTDSKLYSIEIQHL